MAEDPKASEPKKPEPAVEPKKPEPPTVEQPKAELPPGKDFHFTADRGRFVIVGENLGSSGIVRLNGKQLDTTEWSVQRIAGPLPANATPGKVVVLVDERTVRYGAYNK